MYRAGICCSLVVCLAIAGCGPQGSPQLDTSKVTGKVSMNGSPVPGASVAFSPTAHGKPAALGITDSQGIYVLTTYASGDGAVPGDYKVLVTKSAPAATANAAPAHNPTGPVKGAPSHSGPGKAGAAAGGGSLLPEKYAKADTTPITKTVEAKDNTIDIDLQ